MYQDIYFFPRCRANKEQPQLWFLLLSFLIPVRISRSVWPTQWLENQVAFGESPI